MSSQVTPIYEKLLAGNTVSIEFPTSQDFTNLYSQLRTIKSKYEKKYFDSFDTALASDKSIQYKLESLDSEVGKFPATVTFFLATPEVRTKTKFTIISISKSIPGNNT